MDYTIILKTFGGVALLGTIVTLLTLWVYYRLARLVIDSTEDLTPTIPSTEPKKKDIKQTDYQVEYFPVKGVWAARYKGKYIKQYLLTGNVITVNEPILATTSPTREKAEELIRIHREQEGTLKTQIFNID